MIQNTEPAIGPDKVLDVRTIPCSIKHGLVLRTWDALPAGDYFILHNDHDPVPLRYQIDAEYPGTLQWDYVERAPESCQVKLTKLKPTAQGVVNQGGEVYGCSVHS